MAFSLNKPAFHIVLLLALAMAVSSCGRRGAMEAPGSVQADGTEQSATANEEAAEKPKEDKPFILDPLL